MGFSPVCFGQHLKNYFLQVEVHSCGKRKQLKKPALECIQENLKHKSLENELIIKVVGFFGFSLHLARLIFCSEGHSGMFVDVGRNDMAFYPI